MAAAAVPVVKWIYNPQPDNFEDYEFRYRVIGLRNISIELQQYDHDNEQWKTMGYFQTEESVLGEINRLRM